MRKVIKDNKGLEMKVTSNKTIGRNQPCTCGSEKKYKMCCDSQNTVVDYWNNEKRAEKTRLEHKRMIEINNFKQTGNTLVRNTKGGFVGNEEVSQNVKDLIQDFQDNYDMELVEEYGNNNFWHFQNDYGCLILSYMRNRERCPVDSLTDVHGVNIEWILTNPDARNSGWGGITISTLTELADKNGVSLYLHACNGSEFHGNLRKVCKNPPLSNDELVSWYRKYGFDVNPVYWNDYLNDFRNNNECRDYEYLFIRPSQTYKSEQKFTSMKGYDGNFNWDCSVRCFKNNYFPSV